MKTVRTVCPRDCYDNCFLVVKVGDDGRIASVKGDLAHLMTHGFLCPRGKKDPEHVYTNRILFPHVRTGEKPGRQFRRASWDEALDLLVRNLTRVLAEKGSDSVLLLDYAGFTGLTSSSYAHRLWNALAAARTDYAVCSKSGHEGLGLHYGRSYGVQPEELLEKDLIVFWGFNAPVSSPHLWALARTARKERGTRIIAVDPWRSECARGADLWIAPKPGSDVALAMGICRYLVAKGRIDTRFIEKRTVGFRVLREEVLTWNPKRVRMETGLDASSLEDLSAAYASSRKSATMIGIGLQKTVNGADKVRAVSLIPALRGTHRGFFYSNKKAYLVNTDFLSGESLSEKKGRIVSQVALSESLRNGEFAFLFVYGMNPALTLPGQKALRQGLEREGVFLALHDTHWTETADWADVVLPAATFYEKDDLVLPWTHRHVRLMQKAIEPLGESRGEARLMTELAQRLGLTQEWLYEDPWLAMRRAFEGALEEGTFDDLLAGKTLPLKERPRNEYQTPSGKIELASRKARELGFDPLPRHMPLGQGSGTFVLLNSAGRNYTNTQFRENYGPIPQMVLVNPADAKAMGIAEGDAVMLENELGSIRLPAKLSPHVPEGILWAARLLTDLDGRPMNDITSSVPQTIGRGPTFNSTLVTVRKAPEAPKGQGATPRN